MKYKDPAQRGRYFRRVDVDARQTVEAARCVECNICRSEFFAVISPVGLASEALLPHKATLDWLQHGYVTACWRAQRQHHSE
jgi:hypothetical protein